MAGKSEVFQGNSFLAHPEKYLPTSGRCKVPGQFQDCALPHLILDDATFSKHLMFLGAIGTGKTNALYHIISQIKSSLTSNDVMIIFDTKGDFHRAFKRPGDIVISNDKSATGATRVDYWNIFNEIDFSDAEHSEESILEIAKTLFYEKTEKSREPFFANAAKDIFYAILLHFTRLKTKDSQNNEQLRNFLNSATIENLKEILNLHPDLVSLTTSIPNDDSKLAQSIVSVLQQMAREIFVGNFKKVGSLSIRQLVRGKGGRTIFIEYDLGLGNVLTPIYRLLFDMAIKEALSRQKSEGNVWLIADEFRLLPHLQHVENAVNFGRSLGVKFLIGIQNVEQIYEAYSELLAKSILSGFSTTFTFKLSDSTSRTYVKQMFGKNRKKELVVPKSGMGAAVKQVRDGYVVEDWDIANLRIGEAIVGLPGLEPFIFRFKEYLPV